MSFKSSWISRLKKERDGFVEILETFPLFEEWEISYHPEMRVENELHNALEIMYGDIDSEFGPQFLERAIAVAERALEENKLQSELCKPFYPGNRGRLLRGYAHAKFFMGRGLDCQMLLESAEHQLGDVKDCRGQERDMYYEAHLLSAARHQTLCDVPEYALNTIRKRRKYKWHTEEPRLLRAILAGEIDDEFRADFEAYFDYMRKPPWLQERDYFREKIPASVDLALIAAKYLDQNAWPPEPRKIIERISA